MKKRRSFQALLAAVLMILCLPVFSLADFSVVEATEAFYVNDYAQVISAETEQQLLESGYLIAEATGAEVVVVTVDFLGGADIEDYAKKLFSDWQLGDPAKNNGLLLLLAIGEENYWVMQGKGLEDSLSSGKLGTILEEYLEPDFAAADYDAGVKKTYSKFIDELCQIYGVELNEDGSLTVAPEYLPEEEEESTFPLGALILFIVMMIAVFMLIYFLISMNRPRGGGYFGGSGYGGTSGTYRRTTRRMSPPPPPRTRPPMGGGFGTSPRTTTGRRTSSFGGGSVRSSGGGRSFGGRIGGGGSSRGGGAGRR